MFFESAIKNTYQCGIHAVNAYFQKEVVKCESYAEFVLSRINDGRSLTKDEEQACMGNLSILKLCDWCRTDDLVDYIKKMANENIIDIRNNNVNFQEIILDETQEAAANAIKNINKVFSEERFIFLYASHYVTFLKDTEGSWFLLDDQQDAPQEINEPIQNKIQKLIEEFGIGDLGIIVTNSFNEH